MTCGRRAVVEEVVVLHRSGDCCGQVIVGARTTQHRIQSLAHCAWLSTRNAERVGNVGASSTSCLGNRLPVQGTTYVTRLNPPFNHGPQCGK